jgi:hypothetical protein
MYHAVDSREAGGWEIMMVLEDGGKVRDMKPIATVFNEEGVQTVHGRLGLQWLRWKCKGDAQQLDRWRWLQFYA